MKDPLALYTVRKFLELVPISRATFWRYVAKGDIEVVRIYGRTLIPARQLDWRPPVKERVRRTSEAGELMRKYPGEYSSWNSAKQRCTNPRRPDFERYGGAGVKFSACWQKFKDFLADMGPRPTPEHSIDRWPDPYGNYEPGNCRWATAVEQRSNRRTSLAHIPVQTGRRDLERRHETAPDSQEQIKS